MANVWAAEFNCLHSRTTFATQAPRSQPAHNHSIVPKCFQLCCYASKNEHSDISLGSPHFSWAIIQIKDGIFVGHRLRSQSWLHRSV